MTFIEWILGKLRREETTEEYQEYLELEIPQAHIENIPEEDKKEEKRVIIIDL